MPCPRYLPFLASLTVALPALAQQGTGGATAGSSPEHLASLVGVVVDSVHLGGPLVGANVVVDGTTLSAQTDAEGRFHIDSIPPGTYRLAVFHPLLDTLGFSVGTAPLRMGPDSLREVVLATPSPQTIVNNACPEPKRRLGPGAIIGRVFEPDTDTPLDSVRVSFVWKDYAVGQDIGVRRIPKIRVGVSDASGIFVICGVPIGSKGTIQADKGKAQTAEVPLAFDETPLVVKSLTLSLAVATDSTPLVGKALLTGRVTDPNGLPLAGARVTVQGARAVTTSANDGTFSLSGLPSGTRAVLVRRVGFAPVERPVQLSVATPASLVVQLSHTTPTLEPVHIEAAMDSALRATGFTERRHIGMGRYLGPADIERQHAPQLSTLFQMMPGFKLTPGVGTGMAIQSDRDPCVVFWVDHVPWLENQPGELDYRLKPDQLMAIETYSGATAPMEYRTPGKSGCSVVLIWTDRSGLRAKEREKEDQ